MSPVGGTCDEKPATDETQSICNTLKSAAEGKANKKFDEFKAISYMEQLVAGINYFIKVQVGGDDYVHLRVFVPLPYTGEPAELHSIQESKTKEDSIVYF